MNQYFFHRLSKRVILQLKSKNAGMIILLSTAGLVLLLWICNLLLPCFTGWTSQHGGTFGDRFGAANALFSGLALAGIVFSLYMQQQDLRDQRDEMRKSREEHEQQTFQNAFFNLIRNQKELLGQIQIAVRKPENLNNWSIKEYEYTSYQAMQEIARQIDWLIAAFKAKTFDDYDNEEFWNDYAYNMQEAEGYAQEGNYGIIESLRNRAYKAFTFHLFNVKNKDTWKKGHDMNEVNRTRLAYTIVYYKYSNSLSPYFRHLYHILLFLKTQKDRKLIEEEKHGSVIANRKDEITNEFLQYAKFLQAQLLPTELVLILYNALSFPKTLTLLREFKLLENLEEEELHEIRSGMIKNITFKKKKDLVIEALKGDFEVERK